MKTIYYNKQTTQITQTQSKDTIPMTDELMADYRYYASNQQDKSLELIQEVGQVPYLVKYKLDEYGNRYSHYLDKVDEDGYKLPDMVKIQEIEHQNFIEKIKTDIVYGIDNYIQREIDKYNEANNVLFKNVDSCMKYTAVPSYSHYQFCVDIIVWTPKVWEKAREIELDILNGIRDIPTIEQLILELPKFGE